MSFKAKIGLTIIYLLTGLGIISNAQSIVTTSGSGDHPLVQVDLPVTFDNTSVNYDLVDFGGTASSIVVDPVSPSNKVAKTLKTNTAETWAGTTVGGSTGGFANPVPFAPGSTTMSMRVYSPDAGIHVRMKVEDPLDATKSVETEAIVTSVNTWENLVFNFANQAPGTAAINFSYNYKKLSVFFNFGVSGASAGAKTYYWDDIVFGGTGPSNINVTFNVQNPPSFPAYVFGSWTNWGNWPGNPMSSNGNGYYTTTLSFPPNSAHEFLYVSGDPPVKELLNPAWSCTNGNAVYTNRVLTLGNHDTTICFKWDSCSTCFAPVLVPVNLPVTFDQSNVNYDLIDFGGTVSNIQSDPVQPSNLVCKSVKPSSAESWAGTTIGGSSGGFVNPIPFSPGNTIISLRVYSPNVGTVVRLKVEDAADQTKSVETDALTTVANAWDTLHFNFANQASGTPALNFSYVYKKLSVFFNFGTPGSSAGTKIYYWDDVYFGQIGQPPIYITFRVQQPDSLPVFVFGNWNNWTNWPGTPMNLVSPGLYETLLPMTRNQIIEYLFVNGQGPTKEVLDPSWPCTNGNSQYTNRLTHLGVHDTTICYIWETCNSCTLTEIKDQSPSEINIMLKRDGILVASKVESKPLCVEVFDGFGRQVFHSSGKFQTNELIPFIPLRESLYLIKVKCDNNVVVKKTIILN